MNIVLLAGIALIGIILIITAIVVICLKNRD